jgi:hypothetical protein
MKTKRIEKIEKKSNVLVEQDKIPSVLKIKDINSCQY